MTSRSSRSRRKGCTGEREVVGMLNERLGEGFASRLLSQSRDGGEDIDHPLRDRVALEVKRWGDRPRVSQAIDQVSSAAGERTPVLIYRTDRQRWKALVVMDIDSLCDYLREMIGDDHHTSTR